MLARCDRPLVVVALICVLPAAASRDCVAQDGAPGPERPGVSRLRAGFSAAVGTALNTMSTYYDRSRGFGVTLWREEAHGPVRLRGDVEFHDFADRTVTRPYNGTGPAMLITSGAELLLVTAGAEARGSLGRVEGALHAGLGAAYVHSSGAVDSLGTSTQNQRANTYTTLTWQVQGGATAALRLAAAADAPAVELTARVAHAGRTKFLREFNLPVGTISGLYANPTPYAPTFLVVSLGITARL